MGIQNRDGALYFATGIDNTGFLKGKQEAIGIIRSLMSQVTSFDVFGGIGISAAMAFGKAAKDSYNFSKEFQKNMLEVSTISSEISVNFEKYQQGVINMTKVIPVAANDSAKALYQIVSAGHDGAAGMQILEASAKAAVGGVTETATAADAITTLINAYKLSADSANTISDQLFTTARLGKTTFGELGQSIAQAAPLAAAYGVEMDQVLAAVATLTKSGTPTAQAMTQIRASIVGVSKVLGDGAFDTMTYQEALAEVANRAGGSESKLRELIRELEAVNGVLGLTGINAKMAASDLGEMNNSVGATEVAFRKMADGTDAQLQLLQNNIVAYLRPLGETIMESVSGLAETLNEAFANGNIQEALKTMTELLVTAGGAVAFYKTSVMAASIAQRINIAIIRQATIEKKLAAMAGIQLSSAEAKQIAISKLLSIANLKQMASQLKLNAAVLSNPYVLAAAAAAALGYAIYKVVTHTTDAEKAMKRLADANDEYEKGVVSEQAQIDILFGRLKALTEGTKEYEDAKKVIISKYGQYLEGLDEETKSLKNVEDAYRAISDAAIQSAKDRAITNATTKATDVYAETYGENIKKIRDKLLSEFGNLKGEELFTGLRESLDKGMGMTPEVANSIKDWGLFEKTAFQDRISNISRAKAVLKTETEEISALWRSTSKGKSTETPDVFDPLKASLKELENELPKVKAKFKELNESTDKNAYAEQGDLIAAIEKRITEEKKLLTNREQLKSINKEIADQEQKIKDLRKSDSQSDIAGIEVAEKKIKELKGKRETITGNKNVTDDDRLKAKKELDQLLLDSQLKMEAEQISIMQDGKKKRLEESKQEYQVRTREIEEWYKNVSEKRKNAGEEVTPEDKASYKQRLNTNDEAWEKRDSEIEKNSTKEIAEWYKELTGVFETEESRKTQAINARYEKEKEWLQKQKDSGGVTEEEYKTYSIKIDEAKTKEQYNSLLADLNDFKYQEEQLTKEWDAKIAAAGNNTDLADKLQKGKDKALSELNAQMLTQSDEWVKLFDNLDNLTSVEIEKLVATIKGKAKDFKLDPINTKAVLDSLKEAENVLRSRNPFSALSESIKKYKNDEKDVSIKDVFKDIGASTDLIKDSFDAVTDGLGKMGLAGDETTQELLGNISNLLGAAGELAKGIASGNPLSIIQGSIGMITSVFTLFNKDKQHEKKIQSIQKEVQKLERAYDKLGKAIDKSYSSQKVGLIDQQEANLKKQQELLKQQIIEEEAKKKTDQGKIDEWQNQIQDLNDEIAEMKDRRIEAIMGTDVQSALDDFANAYADAWAAGEDKRKAIQDVVKDMIKGAVIEMIKMRMNPEVAKLMEFLSTAVIDGIDSTEQGIIDKMTENIYQSAEAATKGLEQFLNDPEKAAEAKKEAGLAGAIRREMTEETGSELTGLFRSYYDLCKLSLNVNNENLAVQKDCRLNIMKLLEVTYLIEHNTGRTVEELEKANKELKEIKERLGISSSNTQTSRSLGL